MSKEKHSLIVKHKLIDTPFEWFFNSNQHTNILVHYMLNAKGINSDLLKTLRIYNARAELYSLDTIEKRIE